MKPECSLVMSQLFDMEVLFTYYVNVVPYGPATPSEKRKANTKATSLCRVLITSSFPATPGASKSDVTFQLGSVLI